MSIICAVGGLVNAKRMLASWTHESTVTATLKIGKSDITRHTLKQAIADHYLNIVGGFEKAHSIINNAFQLPKYPQYFYAKEEKYLNIDKDCVMYWDFEKGNWCKPPFSIDKQAVVRLTNLQHAVLAKEN